MAFSLLFVGAAQAQEGGYVPPVVDVEPVVVEESPAYDVLSSLHVGLSDGVYFVAIVLPIILTLLATYATLRWINFRFLKNEAVDRANGKIINNVGEVVVLPARDGAASSGVVVINMTRASTRATTDEQSEDRLSKPNSSHGPSKPGGPYATGAAARQDNHD